MWVRFMNSARRNIGFALLVSAFTASLMFNVDAGFTLFKRAAPQVKGVVAGSDVSAIRILDGIDSDGRLHLGDGRPSILYVMAPTCPWCARNLENVRTLAKEAGLAYRFIGLSNTREGLKEYLLKTPLPFPVYAVDAQHLPKGVDPTVTPQLVLVRPDGIVEKVWYGAFGEKTTKDIEALFHVKLPGLLPRKEL